MVSSSGAASVLRTLICILSMSSRSAFSKFGLLRPYLLTCTQGRFYRGARSVGEGSIVQDLRHRPVLGDVFVQLTNLGFQLTDQLVILPAVFGLARALPWLSGTFILSGERSHVTRQRRLSGVQAWWIPVSAYSNLESDRIMPTLGSWVCRLSTGCRPNGQRGQTCSRNLDRRSC